MSSNPSPIAYLVARYPAVSNTFVQREVAQLRRLGLGIETYSVRRVDDNQVLSEADRESFRTTEAILPVGKMRLVRAHVGAFVRSPAAYISTLRFALRRGGMSGKRTLYQLFYFLEAMLLWRSCERQGVRHVHAHMANVAADVARLTAQYATASARDGQRWTWSFTMHGPTEFADVARFGLHEKVQDADFVVCISDYCKSQLMALVESAHWAKLDVVHCGIDTSVFVPVDRRHDGDVFRILCVGRLVGEKGQQLLLHALRQLRQNGVNATLTLVGDGPSRDELVQLAARLGVSGHVEMPGAIGQDEIRAFYQQADVFCLPSVAEGIPVVLMEAMAQQIPVVSTRIAGIPELITDNEEGLLITPGRVDQLVAALTKLENDPELCQSLAKQGAIKVEEHFEATACAEQLTEVFRRYVR